KGGDVAHTCTDPAFTLLRPPSASANIISTGDSMRGSTALCLAIGRVSGERPHRPMPVDRVKSTQHTRPTHQRGRPVSWLFASHYVPTVCEGPHRTKQIAAGYA